MANMQTFVLFGFKHTKQKTQQPKKKNKTLKTHKTDTLKMKRYYPNWALKRKWLFAKGHTDKNQDRRNTVLWTT